MNAVKSTHNSFYPIGELTHWVGSGGACAMVPEIEYFSAEYALEIMGLDPTMIEVGDDPPEEGWYHRLTMRGYLDATDYSGPYTTAWRALRACLDMYDVDRNGNHTWKMEYPDTDPDNLLDPVNDYEG